MSLTITRVARMADLPDDLAAQVRSWPHYAADGTGDRADYYTIDGHTYGDGRAIEYDPLLSEDGERGTWRLTGYAEAGATTDGYRLFVLRFGTGTFSFAFMTPGTTSLTIEGRGDAGAKSAALEKVADALALDLEPATEAGIIAYNAGRPVEWDHHTPGGWGARTITDTRMAEVVEGVWGLNRDRLGRAFRVAWEDQADHDRARDARQDAARAAADRPHVRTEDYARAAQLVADGNPDTLVVLLPGTDAPGAQHDDGVTAAAAIDLVRSLVAEHETQEAVGFEGLTETPAERVAWLASLLTTEDRAALVAALTAPEEPAA